MAGMSTELQLVLEINNSDALSAHCCGGLKWRGSVCQSVWASVTCWKLFCVFNTWFGVKTIELPKVPNHLLMASLSWLYVSEQNHCILSLSPFHVGRAPCCACVSDSSICSLGFDVAPILETWRLCAIAPFSWWAAQWLLSPCGTCVSLFSLVTKWEESFAMTTSSWWRSASGHGLLCALL